MTHEHKTIMTMNGLYCPTCKRFVKDIPEGKKQESAQKIEDKPKRKTTKKKA